MINDVDLKEIHSINNIAVKIDAPITISHSQLAYVLLQLQPVMIRHVYFELLRFRMWWLMFGPTYEIYKKKVKGKAKKKRKKKFYNYISLSDCGNGKEISGRFIIYVKCLGIRD